MQKSDPITPIVAAAVAGIALAPIDPFLSGSLLLAVGVWGWKYYMEHSKLAGVFRNVGLVNQDGQVLQLREKKPVDGGVMYRYSLPPGFCVSDVEKHADATDGNLWYKNKPRRSGVKALLPLPHLVYNVDKDKASQLCQISTFERRGAPCQNTKQRSF